MGVPSAGIENKPDLVIIRTQYLPLLRKTGAG